MTKVIRLTESQLRKIVEKVIAEQSRSGTDPAVLQAIADMSFTKEACRKEKILITFYALSIYLSMQSIHF